MIEVQDWVAPRRAFTGGAARWKRLRSTPLSASFGGPLAFMLGATEIVEPFLANLAGLPPARAGKIFAAGIRVSGPRPDILFVPREAPLVGKTVRCHLQAVCTWRGESGRFARVEAVLTAHGLSALLDRRVDGLTLAERKRARFVEIIALEARVTIVLAPFVGLGPDDTSLAKQALVSPASDRTVVVYEVSGGSAHLLASEARSSVPGRGASVVALTASAAHGASLSVSPFMRAPEHQVVRAMTADARRLAAALEAAPGIAEVKTFDSMVVVWGEEREGIARAIARASHEHGIALGAMQ